MHLWLCALPMNLTFAGAVLQLNMYQRVQTRLSTIPMYALVVMAALGPTRIGASQFGAGNGGSIGYHAVPEGYFVILPVRAAHSSGGSRACLVLPDELVRCTHASCAALCAHSSVSRARATFFLSFAAGGQSWAAHKIGCVWQWASRHCSEMHA